MNKIKGTNRPRDNFITYYGGKTLMLPIILPRIPEHLTYTESFAGGLSVYFAKKPAKCEIINDIDGHVVNFYEVYRSRPYHLNRLIQESLLSRSQHKKAMHILKDYTKYSKIQRAWAFWFLCKTSFNGDFEGNIKFSKNASRSYSWLKNAKDRFINAERIKRLENTQIESRDASKILKTYDSYTAFHYIDPPYINADQGHYSGYTEDMFNNMVINLDLLTGKFLMSCYLTESVKDIGSDNNWNIELFEKLSAASAHHGKLKKKVECLVSNYKLPQLEMEF